MQRRLSAFDQTASEELPQGLYTFQRLMISKSLRCSNCLCLLDEPLSFSKCGHSFCPQCLIELLAQPHEVRDIEQQIFEQMSQQ